MRAEQLSSSIPPGAGRVRDLNWPDYTTAGVGVAPALRCRITGTSFGGATNNFSGLTGLRWDFHQGADCYQMFSGAGGGTGGSFSWLNNVNIQVRTSPVAQWPRDDDWNVHRVVWIGCISGAITSDNDMGVELLSTNLASNGILRTPCAGLGFRFATGGKLNFISRNTATGLSERTIAVGGVGGFLPTDFHSIDIRMFSALPNQPAFLRVLLDDANVLTIPWNDGTLPANGEAGAAFPGFFPVVICDSAQNGATTGLFTKLLSIQAAPTELMTL